MSSVYSYSYVRIFDPYIRIRKLVQNIQIWKHVWNIQIWHHMIQKIWILKTGKKFAAKFGFDSGFLGSLHPPSFVSPAICICVLELYTYCYLWACCTGFRLCISKVSILSW